MKIGILGTRGIPNAYGGFEQFAQYLSEGLVIRGHEVTVYNSSIHPYKESSWNGIKIVHCRDWEDKIGTAGQFLYDYNCFRDARKRDFDILLQLGYTSSSIWFWMWPKYCVNIVNMDGLEWKRSKFGKLTKMFLRYAEKLAVKHADLMVADSLGIKRYLTRNYKKSSIYIPYGATNFDSPDEKKIEPWALKPYEYNLVIARIVPENNIDIIIEGYLAANPLLPLVIIGDTRNKYGRHLETTYTDKRVLYLGSIYDQDAINNIRYFSNIYFHDHSVGGTNPSLLEAMSCKCNIVAHDNLFNRAILGSEASYFLVPNDIKILMDDPPDSEKIERQLIFNSEKVKKLYSWQQIVEGYERVFLRASR